MSKFRSGDPEDDRDPVDRWFDDERTNPYSTSTDSSWSAAPWNSPGHGADLWSSDSDSCQAGPDGFADLGD